MVYGDTSARCCLDVPLRLLRPVVSFLHWSVGLEAIRRFPPGRGVIDEFTPESTELLGTSPKPSCAVGCVSRRRSRTDRRGPNTHHSSVKRTLSGQVAGVL